MDMLEDERISLDIRNEYAHKLDNILDIQIKKYSIIKHQP
jgi:hypothetical protein